jgi:WhiB family redox-sensing transcriptional regulator
MTTTEPSRRRDNLALSEALRRRNDLPELLRRRKSLTDPESPRWRESSEAAFLSLLQPPPWRALAACRGCDPELFFTDRGESTNPAKAVCKDCDVRADCLEYALANKEKFGIWGGLSERERRKLRQARRRAAR